MDQNLIILIIIGIIVFCVWIALLCKCSKSRRISGFKQVVPEATSGYASITDPYTKPFILSNLLTADHCEQIMDYARDKLVDSEVVGGKHQNVRNSQQYWLPKEHALAISIYQFISDLFQIPVENAEDLQIVRYKPNQYYNEHHDSCCDPNEKCELFKAKGGQRMLTVLIYLNDAFTEGNTYFKNLDLKVKPPPGDAVVFFPLADNSSKCHPLALHAGLPVSSGEKWIANLWFRESTFR